MKALRRLLWLWLATAACLAHALTVAELQQLLQRAPRPDVPYEEQRESPWLSAPVLTRGTLHAGPELLEKRVASPRQETWRLLADRVEWVGADGSRKQILFAQAPAVQALADVTRRAVAGDLAALQRDFRITVHGDASAWSAELAPRTPALARQLASVQLQGNGRGLQVLVVSDRGGERTTTRILR